MNESSSPREDNLTELVDIKLLYSDFITAQEDRLNSITENNTPSAETVSDEIGKLEYIKGLIDKSSDIIRDFQKLPTSNAIETITSSQPAKPSKFWFSKKTKEAKQANAESSLCNPECDTNVTNIQIARLDGLSAELRDISTKHRNSLQLSSIALKKIVVELNALAKSSTSQDDTRSIERKRHGLEQLVSSIDEFLAQIVINLRNLDFASEEAMKS